MFINTKQKLFNITNIDKLGLLSIIVL